MDIKERILAKADELFRRYGIKAVTMDDIAAQTGMSKKTIYQWFADKEELVDAVITDIINNNRDCCSQERSLASNAVQEVVVAMQVTQEMFENLNPLILYDLQRNHPAIFRKFQQHKQEFIFKAIRENIERGKKEELYRAEIVTDVAARARLECIMMAFNEEVFPRRHYNLANLHRQLTEIFLYGMATAKGTKLITRYLKEKEQTTTVYA
jgi:TetR/AcrR family transcriptional regulator, cholesterol catabolism regulator